ncbi:GxxExxY protein [Hymenobacter sp. IS2118]|uniref:GxxExxY protein n=1 Tax=Hymenobacter sp. IS2118 TaxID=1505605 RepID=UPI00054D4E79|nr:GxxExxY protein [Hymenobacter sp. IS2118]
MIDNRYAHSELTEVIIGCAMRVHSALGPGFPEVVYQRSLALEMENAGLVFEREIERPVFYLNQQVGTRRVDFLVADTVLVELKATTVLDEHHFAQIINYLTAYRLQTGLLINFGQPSLQFKRFIKTI